jgi:glycerophosphoryl diester phosphodiesterase
MTSPPGPRPLIVAHRGASARAPENTLAAFELAWAEGADAIEGDFRLTADGVVVCHHDPNTGRIFQGSHPIGATTLAHLRTLPLRESLARAWGDLRIPTLEEFLATIPAGRGAYLELKEGPAIVPPVLEALRRGALARRRLVIISFSLETIALCRTLAPRFPAYWLADLRLASVPGGIRPGPAELIEGAREAGAEGVGTSVPPGLSGDLIAEVRAAGLSYHVWTVDDPATARRLAARGVASITTNRPRELLEAFAR